MPLLFFWDFLARKELWGACHCLVSLLVWVSLQGLPRVPESFSPWWSCREVSNTEESRSQKCSSSGQAGGRAKCLPGSSSTACATLNFPGILGLASIMHTYCVATSDGFVTFPSLLTARRWGQEEKQRPCIPRGFPSSWHSMLTVGIQQSIIIAMMRN